MLTLALPIALLFIGLILYLVCTPNPLKPKLATLGLWTYVVALLVVLLRFSGVLEIGIRSGR